MAWYPFDSQVCKMVFTMHNEFSGFARLIRGKVEFHPKYKDADLSLYFIRGTTMCSYKAAEKEGAIGQRKVGLVIKTNNKDLQEGITVTIQM